MLLKTKNFFFFLNPLIILILWALGSDLCELMAIFCGSQWNEGDTFKALIYLGGSLKYDTVKCKLSWEGKLQASQICIILLWNTVKMKV